MSRRKSIAVEAWPILLVTCGLLVVGILLPDAARVYADGTENYIVLYKLEDVPADAATTITSAGGTLVESYDQIGVVIARSDGASFRESLLTDSRIEDAAATTRFAVRITDDQSAVADGMQLGDLPNTPATDNDNLSSLQ